MSQDSATPRLIDIIEAIERIGFVLGGMPLEAFELVWQKQWLIERGIEIISEASRRLPDAMKARHGAIPRTKVAGIGNVLRHDYERISAPVMWQRVREHLPSLERSCRAKLVRKEERDRDPGRDRHKR